MQSFNEQLSPRKDFVIAATLWGQMAHSLGTNPVDNGVIRGVQELRRGTISQLITTPAMQRLHNAGDVGVAEAIALADKARFSACGATILGNAVIVEGCRQGGDLPRIAVHGRVERRVHVTWNRGEDPGSHCGGRKYKSRVDSVIGCASREDGRDGHSRGKFGLGIRDSMGLSWRGMGIRYSLFRAAAPEATK